MGCAQSSNPIDETDANEPPRQQSRDQDAAQRARGGRGQVDGNGDIAPDSSQAAIVGRAGSPALSEAGSDVQPYQQKGRPNKAIKALGRHRPRCPTGVVQFPPPWTRSILERQRMEFWDTKKAYGGEEQAWDAVRSVCNLVREGDLKTAQAVLNAAGLNCPTGRIYVTTDGQGRFHSNREGVWDALGRRYDVPGWVAIDPEDLAEEDDIDQDKEVEQGAEGHRPATEKGKKAAVNAQAGTGEAGQPNGRNNSDQSSLHETPVYHDPQQINSCTLLDTSSEPTRRRKRGQECGNKTAVRVRLSEGGRDFIVHFDDTEPVARLVDKIQQECDNKRVYLIFRGKRLDEKKTMLAQGWKLGDLIQAFVLGPF